MRTDAIEQLLEQHQIRPTTNRILIVRALLSEQGPMSLSELENKILTIDKSNIFRALTTFRQHHLVHVIEGGSDGVRYEICQAEHADVDDDQHLHFFCERCHRTYCLDHLPVPEAQLPDGFRLTATSFILRGICPNCRRK